MLAEVSCLGVRGQSVQTPYGLVALSLTSPAAAVLVTGIWVDPVDCSTAEANERTAAQMDHPSPRDKATITINIAAAPQAGRSRVRISGGPSRSNPFDNS